VGLTIGGIALVVVAACSDSVTGNDSRQPGPRMSGTEFQLEGVTATECQYGGEYPNCKPAPTTAGDAGVAPTPSSDPAAPANGGGGTSPPSDSTAAVSPYASGPLLWGACILGIVGSTVSIYDMADSFTKWHDAYVNAQNAYNLWQVTVQNNADPVTQQLYEFEYRHAYERQQDAAGVVSSSTKTSVMTLVGAGIACGALALAPTP